MRLVGRCMSLQSLWPFYRVIISCFYRRDFLRSWFEWLKPIWKDSPSWCLDGSSWEFRNQLALKRRMKSDLANKIRSFYWDFCLKTLENWRVLKFSNLNLAPNRAEKFSSHVVYSALFELPKRTRSQKFLTTLWNNKENVYNFSLY